MAEMPNIRGYLQELFQIPGFGDTTDFTEIKEHYFIVHTEINPTKIIPVGPNMDWLMEDHDRDRFWQPAFRRRHRPSGPVPKGEEVRTRRASSGTVCNPLKACLTTARGGRSTQPPRIALTPPKPPTQAPPLPIELNVHWFVVEKHQFPVVQQRPRLEFGDQAPAQPIAHRVK